MVDVYLDVYKTVDFFLYIVFENLYKLCQQKHLHIWKPISTPVKNVLSIYKFCEKHNDQMFFTGGL